MLCLCLSAIYLLHILLSLFVDARVAAADVCAVMHVLLMMHVLLLMRVLRAAAAAFAGFVALRVWWFCGFAGCRVVGGRQRCPPMVCGLLLGLVGAEGARQWSASSWAFRCVSVSVEGVIKDFECLIKGFRF